MYLVGVDFLEEGNGLVEEITNFGLGLVVLITFGVKSADASTVLVPLVGPEGLVVTLVVFPVGVHILEGFIFAQFLENGGDVAVLSILVAVRFIGTVTVIRPSYSNRISIYHNIKRTDKEPEEWEYYHRP